jgi:cytochrome c-type biogenesis protein CcmH
MTRTALRTAALALLIALTAAAGTLAPATATASVTTTPRASLTDIESEVMCTSCREPLEVAQSPQADSERAYIRTLIAQGETKPQILDNLVAQYGPAVLGKPPARGFNLAVYIIPPAILVLGAAILAFALPRWRRRTRAAANEPTATAPPPDPADARRLDEDLARFGG